MMNFIMVAAGVMVGTLAATGVMVAILCNKKVLKAYTKYVTGISMEIGKEVADEMMSKMDDEEQ